MIVKGPKAQISASVTGNGYTRHQIGLILNKIMNPSHGLAKQMKNV